MSTCPAVISTLPTRRVRIMRHLTIAALAGAATTAVITAMRPSAPATVRVPVVVPTVLPIPVPAIVIAPLPIPVAFRARDAGEALEPCPARYLQATDVDVTDLPEPIEVVTASAHDVRLLAAWNNRHVFLSTDEGRTFRRVLDAAGPVSDALFDCHGRLHVVRSGGWLGVRDDGALESEGWSQVARFREPEPDEFPTNGAPVRLVLDGTGVALIGVDPTAPNRLLIARSDRHGRWRVARLFEDHTEVWDSAEVQAIEPTTAGRIQLIAKTWQDGDCGGWDVYHRVVFDRRDGSVRARRLNEYPEPRPEPPADVVEEAVLDAAGRWVGLAPRAYDQRSGDSARADTDLRRIVRTRP